MQWSSFALILALATCGDATVQLRGKAESLSLQLEESGESALLSEASEMEAEDRSFLESQLDQTESQLKQLERFAEELSAAPTVNKTAVVAKPAAKTPEPKKEAAPVAKKEVAKSAAADADKMLASLGVPSLSAVKGLKGAMALAPMLAMLKGLYEDSKGRISEQNTREEKSKKWFAEKEVDHKAKLAKIEGKFANHTLSEEFRTNETRDENRYFNYWQRCRERQHRQFHTNLKIQHAMMTKVKKMITMYESALSPKAADQTAAKKQLSQMTGMPEIVFLQNVDEVKHFCVDTLAEVKNAREELHKDSESQQAFAEDGVAW